MSVDRDSTDRRAWLQSALTRSVAGGLAWSGAVAHAEPGRAVAATRPAVGSTAAPGRPARWGLALGGGSARGFAHIGVLKALEQAGLRPDIIVGTSAGALIGAFAASGQPMTQIEELALRLRDGDIADFASAGKRGMLAGEALWRVVNDGLKGARIEQLRTPFAAVATDLKTGDMQLLRQGSVADAVRASCSIPGVFVPRELAGRELVDGGLVSPLPVRAARQLGADLVLAVDLTTRPRRSEFPGLYEVILQSFEIMGRALSDNEARLADLVLRPDTSLYASTDFGVRREMIQVGQESMQALLPEWLRRLGRSAPAASAR